MKKKLSPQKRIPKKVFIRSKTASLSISEILKSKWLIPLLSLGLLILIFTVRKIANYDTGFHLAAGRWILTNFSIPVKDIFTDTVSQNEYLDIQWLYQVVIYSFYLVFNYFGLTLFNSAILAGVFFLLFKSMNLHKAPVILSLTVLFATVISIQLRFGYRPEIVTWLFILLILIILDRYYYFGNGNLFWLPVIMLLWVNMHGLFIIGLFIISVYMITIFIEKKAVDNNLLKWFVISIAAIFINPYFINGVLFPFYLFTRLQKGNIFQQTITELQSPWEMTGILGIELYLYYILSIVSFVLIIITFRNRSFHQFALLAAFFYISFSSFRNIPIFILYAGYIIAICLADILKYENVKRYYEKFIKYEKILVISFTVIFLSICFRVITGAYYWSYNSEIKFGTGIDETILPEKSAEFLNVNSLDGKLINKLELGGWLDWRIKQPVFIDGRLEVIKENFYKEYQTSFLKNGLKNLTEKYEPVLIMNDITNYYWTSQINELKNWRLIHWDEVSSVYAKDNYASDINFNFTSALSSEGIDTNEIAPNIKNEILNNSQTDNFQDWFSGFYKERIKPVELIRMANFAFDNSQYKTAEILYLNFIKKSNGNTDEANYSDIYNNLGSIYYLLNDFQRSIFCYERYLNLKPGDIEIKKRINELKTKVRTN
ncbi:MAG: tetratricopeptide repeat protein [Bacteroidota bacterium]|nr:tetratricopeptide repeat protein [Bacteroidota bacterium]